MILQRYFTLLVTSIISISTLFMLSSCIIWPISKKDVIGLYQSVLQDGTPGLPSGGSEILELKSDGTCIQNITLKNGEKFFSKGTWEWKPNKAPFINSLIIQGIYDIVNEGKIRMDFENTRGILQITSVERNLIGHVIIGSTEGSYYEKK